MADWVLVPSLVALRNAFNAVNPNRDKSSDGSIGDPAHASSSSDHNPDETGNVPIDDADSTNEVHAIDVDDTGPWPDGFSMMKAVRQLVTDHRSGAENRLRYIIYERTIWSASWGWTASAYDGSNPHDKHAHFSASYNSARERDTSPWNIGYVEDEMTPAEFRAILSDPGVAALMRALPWQYQGGGIPEGMSTLGVLNAVHGAGVTAAARDAAEAARDAAQTALIQQVLAAAGNPMTEAQFQETLDLMRQAATDAGRAAVQVLEAKLAAAAQAEADALS